MSILNRIWPWSRINKVDQYWIAAYTALRDEKDADVALLVRQTEHLRDTVGDLQARLGEASSAAQYYADLYRELKKHAHQRDPKTGRILPKGKAAENATIWL